MQFKMAAISKDRKYVDNGNSTWTQSWFL